METRVEDNGSVLYAIAAGCSDLDAPLVTLTVVDGNDTELVSQEVTDFVSSAPVDSAAIGSREFSVFRSGQWRSIANEAWSARDGAGLLVKDGRAFLLGGWVHGPVTNEVWVSDNLRDWTFLGFAPWEARHGSAWLVHKDRLYVIGGDLIADVWSSADGVSWRQEAADAPFGKRYTPNAVSLHGKIIVYAGQHWAPVDYCVESPECGVVGNNDVWESVDDGRTWGLTNPAAPWAGRGLIHGSIVFRDEIYLVGGGLKGILSAGTTAQTLTQFSDIWSSRDGKQWVRRLAEFSFPPRTHFSVLATPIGCFVSDGSVGIQVQVSNDLFYAEDCVNYAPVPDPPLQRRHASSVAYFNGTIVILGGPITGESLTEVWQYIP